MNNQVGFMKDDCLGVQHEYRKAGKKKTKHNKTKQYDSTS